MRIFENHLIMIVFVIYDTNWVTFTNKNKTGTITSQYSRIKTWTRILNQRMDLTIRTRRLCVLLSENWRRFYPSLAHSMLPHWYRSKGFPSNTPHTFFDEKSILGLSDVFNLSYVRFLEWKGATVSCISLDQKTKQTSYNGALKDEETCFELWSGWL